jgi:hypothetical protein
MARMPALGTERKWVRCRASGIVPIGKTGAVEAGPGLSGPGSPGPPVQILRQWARICVAEAPADTSHSTGGTSHSTRGYEPFNQGVRATPTPYRRLSGGRAQCYYAFSRTLRGVRSGLGIGLGGTPRYLGHPLWRISPSYLADRSHPLGVPGSLGSKLRGAVI